MYVGSYGWIGVVVFDAAQSAKAYQHCLHFRCKKSETIEISSSQIKHNFKDVVCLLVSFVGIPHNKLFIEKS